MLLRQLLHRVFVHELIDAAGRPGVVKDEFVLYLIIMFIKKAHGFVVGEKENGPVLPIKITVLAQQEPVAVLDGVRPVEPGDEAALGGHLSPALDGDVDGIDPVFSQTPEHTQGVIVLQSKYDAKMSA